VGGGRGYESGSSGLRSEGGGGLIRMTSVLLPVGSYLVIVSPCHIAEVILLTRSSLDSDWNVSRDERSWEKADMQDDFRFRCLCDS